MNLRDIGSRLLAQSPIANFPVTVRTGLAKGARWTAFPFSANWRLGGGEIDVAKAVEKLPNLKGAVFWDFGAHFGIHTVGLAMMVGNAGQVASFEPDPVAFTKLSKHVAMNNLSNVKLFAAAASSTQGDDELFIYQGGSSNAHFRYHKSDDMRGVPSVIVKRIVPDELVSDSSIREPDLIKIDVQGHGAEVVAGSIKSIKRKRPVIAFSNHSQEEASGARQLLEPLGYQPHDFDGNRMAWSALSEALVLPITDIAPSYKHLG